MALLRATTAWILAATAAAAIAQAPPQPPGDPVRIRGTVEKIDGNLMTVRTGGGQSLGVKLADKLVVIGLAKASVEDVSSGKFIGTTTVGERNGGLVALEIHIFPEEMRGAGEGHRDWDLRPQSKMTNANVASVVAMGKERLLTVQYKGGEKKILVPENVAVVLFKPAERAELKPGAAVFATAVRQPDGSLSAARVNVGLNGVIPPM
jgi:hypothetical protein